MSISTNLSSIQSNQTMMNTSSNNIANAGSYKNQTDLNKEIPNQIVAQDVLGVNVASIKTQDQMLGTLLDMKA